MLKKIILSILLSASLLVGADITLEPAQLQSYLSRKGANLKVWFVKNDYVGISDGSHEKPFTTLVEAESHSNAGDVIYLFEGDGTTRGQESGIKLKNGQRLLGSGRHHVIVSPTGRITLLSSGKGFPKLTSSGKPTVTLANGCEVAGIHITDSTGDAIFGSDVSSTIPHFYGITNTHIHHNIIDYCFVTKAAISLYNCQGELVINDNIIKHILGMTQTSCIDIADALVAIKTHVVIERNTFANGGDYGISINHNAPGGEVTCVVEENDFSEFPDGSALFFGSKKMVALGSMMCALADNIFESSRYGIELGICGSINLFADVKHNIFRDNSQGNLFACGYNKSHISTVLSQNIGDRNYIFRQGNKDSIVEVTVGENNSGEIVSQGNVRVRDKG